MSANMHQETLAFTCGCDDPEPVIDRYQTVETQVGATKCLNCNRIISMQMRSQNEIYHDRMTAGDILDD